MYNSHEYQCIKSKVEFSLCMASSLIELIYTYIINDMFVMGEQSELGNWNRTEVHVIATVTACWDYNLFMV